MVTQIDNVANELRRRIGSALYAPGERLVELNVSADLGVSRTPIRLAFEELTKEGLLERLPTRGFRVKAFSANELADAIDVRGVLEGMAARLVAERQPSAADREVLQACVQEGRDLLQQAAGQAFELDAPRWVAVDLVFVEKLPALIPLDKIKSSAKLNGLPLVQKGSRLSVMPVTPEQWQSILQQR